MIMNPAKQILLSVGVLVDADAEQDALDAIGKVLQAAAATAASATGCESSGVLCWDYLGTESANAVRCSVCEGWASAVDQPNQVGCIGLGHWIGGDFFRTQCRLPPRTS